MKKTLVIAGLISIICLSCSKSGNTNTGTALNHNGDNTASWVGIYTGATGGSNTVNRVVIAKVNDSVVQMQLQINYSSSYYTFATVQDARLTSTTTTAIDETGNIAGYRGTYHFTGSAILSGNALTISGNAARTDSSSPNPVYYFSGSK